MQAAALLEDRDLTARAILCVDILIELREEFLVVSEAAGDVLLEPLKRIQVDLLPSLRPAAATDQRLLARGLGDHPVVVAKWTGAYIVRVLKQFDGQTKV